MRKLKNTLVFLGILLTQLGYSQEKGGSIYIDPIQIIGMDNTSIDFGYVYFTGTKLDYQTEFGIIIPGDGWGSAEHLGTGRKKGRGFEIGFAPRLNFKKFYIAYLTTYKYHKYQSNRLISQSNQTLIKYDILQQVISPYLVIGAIEHETEIFSIDCSIGLGPRFINIMNNAPVPDQELSYYQRLSNYIEPEENGWHMRLGIKLSFKFGFRIFHSKHKERH